MGLENLPLVGSYAKLFSLKELDLGPAEASVVTKIRWCQVLRGLLTNINKPAMLAQFLVLCKGDAALMAAEMGRTQAAVNLSWLLLAPGVRERPPPRPELGGQEACWAERTPRESPQATSARSPERARVWEPGAQSAIPAP